MGIDGFFTVYEDSRQLFDDLRRGIDAIGPAQLRVTTSQIAFCRRRTFAWVWIPARYLRGRVVPLVLTLTLRHRDPSARWKEIIETRPGHFTNHLELFSAADIDDEAFDWLESAWASAG